MGTNYRDAFITVATDYGPAQAREPGKAGSIARLQLDLLREAPYTRTSDELLFEVHAIRAGIAPEARAAAHAAFFGRPQACLRCSPLVKTFGWGLHHDADGRVAAYALESADYRRLSACPRVTVVPGMRSRRA